jgi:hypothetical protein
MIEIAISNLIKNREIYYSAVENNIIKTYRIP